MPQKLATYEKMSIFFCIDLKIIPTTNFLWLENFRAKLLIMHIGSSILSTSNHWWFWHWIYFFSINSSPFTIFFHSWIILRINIQNPIKSFTIPTVKKKKSLPSPRKVHCIIDKEKFIQLYESLKLQFNELIFRDSET